MRLPQMSLSGAMMIFIIIIVRILGRNRLPKKMFLLLWSVVMIRLLIPFSIPSSFSVYSWLNQNAMIQERVLKEQNETVIDWDIEIPLKHVENVSSSDTDSNLLQNTTQDAIQNTDKIAIQNWHIPALNLRVIWLLGTFLCAMVFVIAYLCCYMKFHTALPLEKGTNKREFVCKWLSQHACKRTIEIRQSSQIIDPLTYGIWKPVILLPKSIDWENEKQLQYILLHEYMHICHYDVVWKFIATVTICIHWFNPMVWMMYFLLNKDIELVCDGCVIREIGEQEKATYARMLIHMEEKKSGLMPLCNNFSENAIEERIVAIMKTKKITYVAMLVSILIFVAVTTVFTTSAKAKETSNVYEKVLEDNSIEPVGWKQVDIPVFDTEDYLVKVTGIGKYDGKDYHIKLYCENKSMEKKVCLKLQDLTINGMYLPIASCISLDEGESKEHEVIFGTSLLEYGGVRDVYTRKEYTDIAFYICDIENSNYQKIVHLYPQGKENAIYYVREPQPTDQILIDNDYVTVTIIGYDTDVIKNDTIRLFIQNKTDANVSWRVEDMLAINGTSVNRYTEVDGELVYWNCVSRGSDWMLLPNSCSYASIVFPWRLLEGNQVRSIKNCELVFKFQYGDVLDEELLNKSFLITPTA